MFSTKPRYFPRNLGVSSPQGANVHEFLVVWDHELGSLAKILQVFSTHKVKVILTHSQLDEGTGAVVGTYYCDMSKADEPVEGMKKAIKRLDFVRDVETASARQSLRQVPLPRHRVGAREGHHNEAEPSAEHREEAARGARLGGERDNVQRGRGLRNRDHRPV